MDNKLETFVIRDSKRNSRASIEMIFPWYSEPGEPFVLTLLPGSDIGRSLQEIFCGACIKYLQTQGHIIIRDETNAEAQAKEREKDEESAD